MSNKSDTTTIVKIPLERIRPLFPREEEDSEISELANSIRLSGVLHPVLVRRGSEAEVFELICGYRRFEAAKKAGLDAVPAIVVKADDSESIRLCIMENLCRKDLSDVQVSKLLKRFKDLTGYSDKKIAALLGKSRRWVSYHLKMLELEGTRVPLEKLSERHIRSVLSEPEPIRPELIDFIAGTIDETGKPPSIKQIEHKAKQLLKPELPVEEVGFESAEEILEAAEEAATAPGAGEVVELKTAEDVDRFFDEILKTSTPAAEETMHECPCGCGWSLEVNWKRRDVCWIAP